MARGGPAPGRTAVVAGATSGIGHCTAREPNRPAAGARALLASRSGHLDLGDLSTVRAFAKEYDADRLDLLVGNAGVTAPPHRTTPDGFQSRMGVKHLGPFALTGLLMPHLLDIPGARVVTVSSVLRAMADVDLGDHNSEPGYRRWIAYARSRSANLLFVHELARRPAAVGADTVAAAAHPGYARTNLRTRGVRMENRRVAERLIGAANRVVGQSAEAGAPPLLYAATAPGVRPDSFTGPRLQGRRGSPAPSWRARWTLDDRSGGMLRAASGQLTGVSYPLVPPVA
ncbi:SDR family NAD(P)-dependent oxidoreductase [Streptomyces sp. NPDC002574]|uniref:SDR family NAD(P)-dependent oxidoreductase n=1 Tax=Streptomyces sp. NPDC002574 TaxID=3364652 RepID=UPI0036B981BC